MAKAKDLVIVESPAKAKTIEKYLGSGYKVTASMGHLRDLPKSKMGVDIEHGFEPKYIPVRDKKELIDQLKKDSKAAKTVYLATDPDREGEAISWHLKELLDLPDEKARRVTFNEITKKVVTESIQHPRDIDQDLVDAQQARRILDRIVGYELSPLLWKKVKSGLSAGRVQSVATRMVFDREQEIEQFEPEEYWFVDAELRAGGKQLHARLIALDGERVSLSDQAQADAAKARVEQGGFVIRSVKRGEKRKHPAPPFTTSNLQQEASRKLGFTTAKTMQIAQQLYEGVDVAGEGTVGLITYMRTDSLRLSEEAIAAAKGFINATDCADYLTKKGMPFRDAYKLTGCMVSDCIAKDKTLEELTLDEFKGYSALFENDIYDAIDLIKCCEGRTSYGGPSEASVNNQIRLAMDQLAAWEANNA